MSVLLSMSVSASVNVVEGFQRVFVRRSILARECLTSPVRSGALMILEADPVSRMISEASWLMVMLLP